MKSLSRGVDILVATPGRLLDLMNQGHIKLKGVEFFVLDEIDRMLDMGFIQDMRKIVSSLPKERQSLFFSATMSEQTSEFAKKLLTNAVRVESTPQESTLECIKQRVFFVDQNNKFPLLQKLFNQEDMDRVLVFTRTKHRADKITRILNKNKINADAIHGNKSQKHRTKAMNDFKAGRLQMLVATDIAARGIDVEDISHVINYDLPNETESYIHRIGRTGRAGANGTAYSFCAADERGILRSIEKLTQTPIEASEHKYHSEKAKNAVGSAAEPTTRNRSRPASKNARPKNRHKSSRRKASPVSRR